MGVRVETGRAEPLGALLAGGEGRRIGGAKATVELSGRPLISYPLAAMRAALSEVAVVAKAGTPLPPLDGVSLWIEPDAHSHPLVGVVYALAMAEGRAVLVCAVDLPFVTPAALRALAFEPAGGAGVVIAAAGELEQPLLARYEPRAAARLSALLMARPEAPVREAVAELAPRRLELDDPQLLFNVNGPEDILRAAALMDRRAASRR